MELGESLDPATAVGGDPIGRVQAYRLAGALVEQACADAERLRRDVVTQEVAAQLLRSAGSVRANIAEGYSRGTAPDRRKFYEYALGSARECRVWYETARPDATGLQLARLDSIRRLLLTMIRNSRADTVRVRSRRPL
jgi:four helix bundle protein